MRQAQQRLDLVTHMALNLAVNSVVALWGLVVVREVLDVAHFC